VKAAQALKAQAVEARDNGDYDLASQYYRQAAEKHPKADVQASYLMNAVGAMVGTWAPRGGWRWDTERGPAGILKALDLCASAQTLLDHATKDNCHSKGVEAEALQDWIVTQRDFLLKMKKVYNPKPD